MIDPGFIEDMKFLIGEYVFEHFYLIRNVLSANQRNVTANKAWVMGEQGSWILGFCAEGQYHIYGTNWSDTQKADYIKYVDFNEIPDNFQFAGNRELIELLIVNNSDVKFNLFKNRIFYEIRNVSNKKNKTNAKMRVCELKDLDEITRMNCDFFVEEYSGENNKKFEELRDDMKKHVINKHFYLAENKNGILAFCSRFDTQFNNPMIGTIFVKSEFRNQGFGQFLLKEVSELILARYDKCWLITDEKNISSNVLVENIGFRKIYDYTSGSIKKTVANDV